MKSIFTVICHQGKYLNKKWPSIETPGKSSLSEVNRPGRHFGQGKRMGFRISRDHYGNFHPQILAILRNEEEECDKFVGVLYAKDLKCNMLARVRHGDKESYHRVIPRIREDKTLFPDEEPMKGEQASRNGAALLAELKK